MIDHVWHTDRLRISDTMEEDLPALVLVLESNRETLIMEGMGEAHGDELRRWLDEGCLPPGGRKECHRLQTICRIADGEVIGYLSVYHGYPDQTTVYIGTLSIRRDCYSQGFGSEVVEQMLALHGLKEYPSQRLLVTIRNWGAVRFWTRHGFTQVTRVLGELCKGDGSTAKLELVRVGEAR
jgi:ribosomal protein S18 acetylase RimI-like enzyme